MNRSQTALPEAPQRDSENQLRADEEACSDRETDSAMALTSVPSECEAHGKGAHPGSREGAAGKPPRGGMTGLGELKLHLHLGGAKGIFSNE